MTARELLDIIEEQVQCLPAPQRSVIVLCCLEGRTREEAARQLGWTLGAVKNHLQRGRQRLQERLARRGIALSAVLAIVAVSRGEAMPALLLQNAVQAALGGGIGSTASALANSVLQTMFWPKLAGVLAVTLTLALAASTTVALVYRGSSAQAPEDQKSAVLAWPKDTAAGKPQVRTDALGDPLPPGAIARLGTVRFRQGDDIARLRFTPDGKRLLSSGKDGVRVWDAATGKELRRLAPPKGDVWSEGDLSHDGKLLAVSSVRGGSLELWDVDSGKKIGATKEKCYGPFCFSPDSKWLATIMADSKISIWDVKSLKKKRSWRFQAGGKQINVLAFSADSSKLLSNGVYDMVRIWDAATGKYLQDFMPLGSAGDTFWFPYPMTLSPDGKLLALIEMNDKQKSPSGKVEVKARLSLRDVASGKVIRQLTCPAYEVVPGQFLYFTDVAFTPDGKSILTSGPDPFVRMWDLESGKELRRLPVEGVPGSLALSRDGKKLAVVMMQGTAIRVLDLASGQAATTPGGHLMRVMLAALTPDGRTALTGDPFSPLFAWDAATGRIQRRFDTHDSRFLWMQLSDDGRTLFASGTDKTLHVWDVASGKEQRRMAVESDPAKMSPDMANRGLALTPDGKTLAVVNARNTIRILDAANGAERQHFQGPERLLGMRLTPDGHSLIAWSSDYMVRLWDVTTGRKLQEYPLPKANGDFSFPDDHFNAAVSPDGRLLAMGPMGHYRGDKRPPGFLIFMDLATGRIVHRIDNLPSETALVAFSPDNRMLAWTGFDDSAIRLLEVASGCERRRLSGHRGQITALAFSADGRRLLSGCNDTTALVWDLGSTGPAASAAELETLWADLAGEDAARAYRAIHRLAASPSSAVRFIRKRLRPASAVDAKHLARLVADLDNDDFTVRENATAELQKLGEVVLPAYRTALEAKPSLESRRRLEDLQAKAHTAWWDVSGERLRSLRAIETLERAGTKEAREVLQALAGGAKGARLTEESKAARNRLQR